MTHAVQVVTGLPVERTTEWDSIRGKGTKFLSFPKCPHRLSGTPGVKRRESFPDHLSSSNAGFEDCVERHRHCPPPPPLPPLRFRDVALVKRRDNFCFIVS